MKHETFPRRLTDEQSAKIAAHLRHLATRPGAGFRNSRDDADQFRAAPFMGNPL